MKRRLTIAGAILLLLIITFITFNYFKKREDKSVLTLYGNVDVRQVDIGLRVAGKVDKLHFEEGDLVEQGQLMVSLDTSPYNSQLAEAQSAFDAIKVNFETSALLLKRRQELIESSGVSQEDLDTALSNYNQLKANLLQAESAVQIAKDNLSFTEAYAPSNGFILTRIKEPGSVVNVGDPVFTLSIASPVWIRAYVTEPDLGYVRFGMEAKVSIDTKGAPIYTGRVGFISPIAEFTPKTVETTQLRTDLVYRLRIYIDCPDGYLKQGMPVTVRMNRE